MMCFDTIDNIRILMILLGNLYTELYMGSFLFKVNSFADVMKQTGSTC